MPMLLSTLSVNEIAAHSIKINIDKAILSKKFKELYRKNKLSVSIMKDCISFEDHNVEDYRIIPHHTVGVSDIVTKLHAMTKKMQMFLVFGFIFEDAVHLFLCVLLQATIKITA